MLSIPATIAEATAAQDNQPLPAMFLDIYADTGDIDVINTTSRWSGQNDPAVVNDVNVDYARKPGSMLLSAGTYVAPAHAGTDTKVADLTCTIRRSDFMWIGMSISTKYTLIASDMIKFQSFLATHTQIIDDVIIVSRSVGTGGSTPVTVRLISVDTGNQVGNAVTFTPTGSVAQATLSGFAASVIAGKYYKLQFEGYIPQTIGSAPVGPYSDITIEVDWTIDIELYGYVPTDPIWRIPFGSGTYVSTGGKPNYVASGSFDRTLDIGSVPIVDGRLLISDIVPSGTSMNIALYHTDSAIVAAESAITNWVQEYSSAKSGFALTQHRWWRIVVTMNSNTAHDLTPELASVEVQFMQPPVVVGTTAIREYQTQYGGLYIPPYLPIQWATIQRLVQTGIKALNSVSSFSAQLSPQFAGSMIGSITATMLPEDVVNGLLARPLKNKQVIIRAGYVGIAETMNIFSGSIDDITFSNNLYTLEMSDHFKIADVSIPASKAGPSWATATTYALNDIVIQGTDSYICILGHTSSTSDEPGVGTNWTTYWLLKGTVWATIDYSTVTHSGTQWHLCEIILDILTNQINIPSERIDFKSIADVQAALPTRTGTRVITKPTKATELLGELAWLCESQFVMREGLFSLVKEPSSSAPAIEDITPQDIKPGSLKYRRGWRDMVNQAVIITGYSGDGIGSDKFNDGEVYADTTSIADYNTVVQKTWLDKWNVPSSELQDRELAMVNRYKDGRKVIDCEVSMRLIAVEPGDVVTSDNGVVKCVVIRKVLDFSKQSIQLGLLGV